MSAVLTATEIKKVAVRKSKAGLHARIQKLLNKPLSHRMPKGDISPTGIVEIKSLLKREDILSGDCRDASCLSCEPRVEWTWMTKRGTLSKRIAARLKQKLGISIPPAVLSKIGSIAKRHSGEGKEYYFDFVSRIDWGGYQFGQVDSCWWLRGSENYGLDAWEENGGLAARFYPSDDERDIEDGCGRIWICPDKLDGEDILIAFNGYWKKGGATLELARVLATFFGMTYQRVGLEGNGFYINGCLGYLIGPEQISSEDNWELPFSNNERRNRAACVDCSEQDDIGDMYTTATGEMLCTTCHDENWTDCSNCGYSERNEEVTQVVCARPYYPTGIGSETIYVDRDWCYNCTDRYALQCVGCDKYYPSHSMKLSSPDAGSYFCPGCLDSREKAERSEHVEMRASIF